MLTWAVCYMIVKTKADAAGCHLIAAIIGDVFIFMYISVAIAEVFN